jgi:TonB family protein
MNCRIFAISLFLLGALNVFSQAPLIKDGTAEKPDEVLIVGEVRGTIKRKAVFLPKPPYPREAFEAGADGAVRVEVVIDAEGSVVSAKAVAGNPLLFAAAEETARKTKFRRAEIAADATETGFITYNFAIERATWLRIGYDLAVIQKAPTLRPFMVGRIAKAFQTDWTSELEILGKLAEMRRVEMETQNASPTPGNKPALVRKSVPNPNGAGQIEVWAEVFVPKLNPPTIERIALAQNLTALLQSRFAADEANLWRLNLGANIFNAFQLTRNPSESRNAALILRQSLDGAPAGTPAEALAALRQLIEILESGRRSVETMNETGKAMSVLFRIK